MDDSTRKIVIGVAITAAVLFVVYSCGQDRGYYCIQWEGPTCVDYGTDLR